MTRFFALAMILAMLWPADGRAHPAESGVPAAIPADAEVVFGPATFVRGRGTPEATRQEFDAQPGSHTLLVEDLGPTGVLVQVWANGQLVLTEHDLAGRGRTSVAMDVTLLPHNALSVLLAGRPGSRVRVTVYGAARSAAWQEPCDAASALFTEAPVAPELLRAVVPLGELHPPAHTLPMPHVSLSPGLDAAGVPAVVPVYAPGRATLVAVERRTQEGEVDLSLHLQPCRDVRTSLLHLGGLAPDLEAEIESSGERYCPGPDTCLDAVEVEVAAGTLLGYGGGPGRAPIGVRLEDRRQALSFANPDRYAVSTAPSLFSALVPFDVADRVVPDRRSAMCALDFFGPAVRTVLEAKLASADGARQRSALPLCGEHAQDAAGTAQGNWFAGATDHALLDEATAAALVHDNVDPGRGVFSIGSVLPWGPDVYLFTPALGGYVNTDFDLVAPGAVYCYQGLRGTNGSLGGSVLVEVFSAAPGVGNRLRVEHRAGRSCTSFPWSFGANAQVLQR